MNRIDEYGYPVTGCNVVATMTVKAVLVKGQTSSIKNSIDDAITET